MKWGFRWYGEKDSIPLKHFKQVKCFKAITIEY